MEQKPKKIKGLKYHVGEPTCCLEDIFVRLLETTDPLILNQPQSKHNSADHSQLTYNLYGSTIFTLSIDIEATNICAVSFKFE